MNTEKLKQCIAILSELLNEAEKQVEVTALPAAETATHETSVPAKPLTLEEVRAVLADKSRQGHTAEIHELLRKHGADKLSAIDPGEYKAMLAEAETI